MNLRLLPLFLVVSLVGCDSSSNEKPADAVPVAKDTAPAKTPSTPEEKIAAIQKSSMPEEQKKATIERVRSGKL